MMNEEKEKFKAKQLEEESPIPLYHQLSTYLEEQVEKGILKIGDHLPNELELADMFKVSRTTVRLALQELESKGYIKRNRGKGTLITPRIEINIAQLLSFTQEISKMGFIPGTILLNTTLIKSDSKISKIFDLQEGSEILKVTRLRTASDQPIGYCVSYLNIQKFPELRFQDYSQTSLYDVFEKNLNIAIFRASQKIFGDIANKEEAKILKISKGHPVLRVFRTTYTKENIPIESVEATFNAKFYFYSGELYREQRI